MKEYLYRGKRKDNGEWIYGRLLYDDVIVPLNQEFEIKGNTIYGCDLKAYIVIPKTVGQYIQLRDKNNHKIFEGDIVKQYITYHATNEDQFKTRIGYIAFLQQECGFSLILSNSDVRIGHRNTGSDYAVDINMEIIGNIYENPELMR